MYLARPAGRLIRTTSQCSWGSRLTMVAVPSVWPWTRWPPSRSARRTERSRLTLVPGATDLRLECRSVSPITSAAKPSGVGERRFLSLARRPRAGADQRGDRQADAADADRVARPRVLRHHGAANVDAGEIAEMLDRLDLAEVLNDAGKQPRPPPVRLRGTRLLASFGRALLTRRCNAAGHARHRPAARVLPPIRTLTVGPGVPPGQPAAVAAGSRTITAGSEFHRPRSTLTSANQCATRDIPTNSRE